MCTATRYIFGAEGLATFLFWSKRLRPVCPVSLSALALGLLLAPASPVLGQSGEAVGQAEDNAPPPPAPEDSDVYDEDTILVLGARLAGQVDTPNPPILELDSADIAAYGAGSIAELLEQLGPQVSSARGRGGGGFPILLVNGVRISSPRELRSYPPEAIEKLEVFPEEVALQYGYSPDQRVVNIILKDNYSSREVEAEYGQPFRGGFSTQEVEATLLRIDGPSRLNINLDWNNASLLTEAERGVVQSTIPTYVTDPDPAAYRSLRSDTAGLEGTVNWTTTLGRGNSLSVNATYERSDSFSLQGLDSMRLTDPADETAFRTFNEGDPLTFDSRSNNWSAASTLNLGLGDWDVTGTIDGTYTRSRSFTARNLDTSALVDAAAAGTLALDADLGTFADAGDDEARSKTYTTNALVTANTMPLYLPAGDVTLTLRSGYRWNRIESEDTRNPGIETQLSRGRIIAGANLGVPLTSRDAGFGGAVGDITLNFSGGINHLSDFGTLYDWTAGVTWGLTDALTFSVTHVNRDDAPSLSQLGNPEVATFNVPVFDLVNNETVLATVISGGNPFLPRQNQSDWKFGVQWELPFIDRGRISADYIRNRSTDVASSFPVLTPEIEAAFPDRVTRDAGGTLVQLDRRPITYAQTRADRLQFGLNLSGQISGNDAESAGSNGSQRGGGNRGGGSGGPAAMAGGAMGGGQAAGAEAPQGRERFARLRTMFCEADPEEMRRQFNRVIAAANAGLPPPVGEDGQPINLPPEMLRNLAGEDGVIDETEFATMRERLCSGDGPAAGEGGGPGFGGAGFGGGNPEMFQQMRTTFCSADVPELVRRLELTAQARARGEEPGEDALPVPQRMLDRLTKEDGSIDAEAVAQMKQRFCSGDGPAAAGGAPGADGPPANAGGGGPGMRLPFGRGGRGGGNGGRWFMNLQYTLELKNEVLIAPGVPLLDLLDGDSNQPRHTANMRVGTFYNGFGMFLNGRYTGSSTISGTGQVGSTDLNFGDYVTFDIRAFADLDQRTKLVEAVPLLKGTRIAFSVDNIFDARQKVTDSNGVVPISYQPFLIDPVGRSFEIEFRKLF